MNELDLKTLQLAQQAMAKMIRELADKAKKAQTADLMTAQEVAALFHISVWRFYHSYKARGLTPIRRMGRKLLFRRDDVNKILDQKPPRRGRPPKRYGPPQTSE